MPETFRQGFLQASADRVEGPEAFAGQFDLMLLASSWDARCTEITKSSRVRTHTAVLLLFNTRDTLGLRDLHDQLLKQFCASHADRTVPIEGPSTDVEAMWARIRGELLSNFSQVGRPLRLLLDLSTCPRYYAAALIGETFASGIASSITVFYSEGHYPEQADVVFTLGRWRAVAVPSLSGRYDPTKKRFFLVSAGWEGERMLRVVQRADPDRVSVLFPDPGFEPGYVAEAKKRTHDLLVQYCIPPSQVTRAAAGNAVAAWRALTTHPLERIDKENVSYLMTGTKPHSIALVLRALALGRYPTVLYVVPEEHAVLRTRPNGVYWRYDVSDVTALPWG